MAAFKVESQTGVNARFFPIKPGLHIPIPLPPDPSISTTHPNPGSVFPNETSINNFTTPNPNQPEIHPHVVELCAPFPPCHPLGCGSDIAPIECEDCDATAVALTVVGMCLLAILIVFTNVVVIVIIMRTVSLRRRHGFIKVSLAVSDLLIGLFVIPAAIYNLASTLYLAPQPNPNLIGRSRSRAAEEFVQINSVASVLFGTLLIISVTSSVYNLLLLSLDRFLAVAKPLQSRSGKYFSKKRLRYCIIAVWMFGVVLSSFPAFFPSKFSYMLDGTTFFYVQSPTAPAYGDSGTGALGIFALFVLGLPYIAVVILNICTMVITFKRLKVRKSLGSRYSNGGKSEQAKRMKLILESCPEMKYGGGRPSFWSRKFELFGRNNSNNNPGKLSRDRFESVNSVISRHKTATNVVRNMNSRVLRMISTMVAAFTVCLCPYVIVTTMMTNGSLNCSNVGVAYNVAVYFVLMNSASNFFIYNLWHREFRKQLCATLTGRETSSSRPISTPNGIVLSSDKGRGSSAGHVSTFARESASYYQMRKIGGVSSFREPVRIDTEL